MKFFRYTLKKLGGALITLVLAASLAFFISHLAGDPTVQMLGMSATPEQIAELKAELGFDRPLVVQYGSFINELAHADLGQSLYAGESNFALIQSRIWASIQLTMVAMVLGVVLGIPLGVYAAAREGRLADRVISSLAILGQSIPVFWLGLMLVLLFSITLNWLPAGLSGDWKNLVLPAVTLATIPLARVSRLTRAAMSNTLEDQFITAARARGLGNKRVLFVHALKNASLPVVTLIGMQMGILLSGAITVETVFAWPGLGSLATQAVRNQDLTLVQALVVYGAFLFVIINLFVELLYGVLDPRIRDARQQ